MPIYISRKFSFFRVVGTTIGKNVVLNEKGYVPSRDEIQELMEACKNHLKIFKTDKEIDFENDEHDRRYEQQEKEQREKDRQQAKIKSVRTGFIYLFRNNRNGFIKIGFSKNPAFREKTLQAEEPEIEMLFCFESTFEVEERLHERFKRSRIRGEWFKLLDREIEALRKEFCK